MFFWNNSPGRRGHFWEWLYRRQVSLQTHAAPRQPTQVRDTLVTWCLVESFIKFVLRNIRILAVMDNLLTKIHVIPQRSFRRFFIFCSLKQYHIQLYCTCKSIIPLIMHLHLSFKIENCNVGLVIFEYNIKT